MIDGRRGAVRAGSTSWSTTPAARPRPTPPPPPPGFFESIVALNLLAPLYCAQAANAVMQGQEEGGSIVNIASVSGIRPSPGTAAYGAAKAGLINLTQSLAIEWAPKVRVNCLSAGMVATEAADDHYGGPEGMAAVAATVPLGRFGTPEDVAGLCLFLASPLAGYVTGANLVAHGGGERPAFLAAVERSSEGSPARRGEIRTGEAGDGRAVPVLRKVAGRASAAGQTLKCGAPAVDASQCDSRIFESSESGGSDSDRRRAVGRC